jgi:ArsR family transcriptional regulator, zinc-responsive transcriptional repressor
MIKTTNRVKIEKLEWVASIFKTIAHPIRLEVISILDDGEFHPFSELLQITGVETSLLSHHMTKMRLNGVLTSYKEGRCIYYKLAIAEILKVYDCIANCDLDNL